MTFTPMIEPPSPVEALEGGRATTAVGEPAAGNQVGAADACATVQIHRAAGGKSAVDGIQDFAHLRVGLGDAMVADWLPQVRELAARLQRRERGLVGRAFRGIGQVDEAVDAGIHEQAQAFPRRVGVASGGVLAGEQAFRLDPVAVLQRRIRHYAESPACARSRPAKS